MQKIKNKSLLIPIIIIFNIFLVSAISISSISSSPEQIAPGQTATISLEIENNLNDDAENIQIALDFLSNNIPIAPHLSSSEQTIEEIKEDKEEFLEFDIIVLPEAKSGVYKIPVKISYEINNKRDEKTGLISILVNAEPKITISAESALIKGEESQVIIRIINDGLTDVKFISVEAINPPRAKINSKTYEYIGNLDSDDFDTIEYSIFTEENAPSQITIPLIINYKDSSNKDFTKTESIKLPVYTKKEAQSLGLIEKPNYTIYIVIATIILIFIAYRLIKYLRKRKQ